MHVSEARLAANRANALKSRGPSTPEGRAISSRNGFKHGLTGQGLVTPEGDADEIARRLEALNADMKPRTEAGAILILRMATLSVRAERAAEHESAAIARNVRHAADDFDETRFAEADELFESLHENLRTNLRKLKKRPEGVERLIEGWNDLRQDLTADTRPAWTADHLERAANLTGTKAQHMRGSRLGALSRGVWGDFAGLSDQDGGGLEEEDRKAWAKAELIEQIDAEVEALEAHYETLDFETIEIDRAEAGQRALFDASKPAALARRYESEALRGFFKCLKEFRQVEVEVEAQAEAIQGPSSAPKTAGVKARMGSSREIVSPPGSNPPWPSPDHRSGEDSVIRGLDGEAVRASRPLPPPR